MEIMELCGKLEKECKYEEASEYLRIALEEKLGPYDIQKDIGRVLNKMGRFDEALTSFEIVLAMEEYHVEALFGKGVSNIGLNNFNEALELFNKVIVLDKLNANAWYYKSILSYELGDSQANIYFRRFKKLDNNNFKVERSGYNFGILFYEIEYKFRENFELKIIFEVKDELKSLNLNDEEYSKLIRITPLEDLFNKLGELKKKQCENDSRDIIRNELITHGFSEDDADDMFFLYDDLEELKKELISLIEKDPFQNTDKNITFVPIKKASKYNIFKNVKRLTRNKLCFFNEGNYFYDNKEFKKAIDCYEKCLKFNPDNKMIEYVKFCANYNLKENNDEF